MCRLRLAYPRERQTQSSSSPQFKVVTRPLEFLILIASTGPRLRHRQRPGWEESRPLLRERGREKEGERDNCLVFFLSLLLLLYYSKVLSFFISPKKFKHTLEMLLRGKQEAICRLFYSALFIYSLTSFMKTTLTNQREPFKPYSYINADFQTVLISERPLITKEEDASHIII